MARFKLKDLSTNKLEYGSGASACEYDGKTRYVRITDIDNDGQLGRNVVSPNYIDEKYILNDGDVLFARTGATVGKAYRYKPSDGRCMYGGFLIKATPNPELIRADYLYYFTKSPQYKSFVQRSMKVVAQPNINAKQYGNLELEVPPLSKQDEIVNKLSKTNLIINNRKLELIKMDELVKARFVEMFGNPEDGTCRFDTKKLGELSTKISDGVHAKPKYTETGKPFLSVVNINRGIVDFTDCKYVSEEAYQKMIKSTHPEKGDVLYTKVGATYGIPAFVDTSKEFCLYVSVCLIKPKHEMINARFLSIQMGMPSIKHQADVRIKGIGVPDLHLNQIREFDIICPPRAMQDVFVDFVDQVDKSKATVRRSLDENQKLFDGLMQQYFG